MAKGYERGFFWGGVWWLGRNISLPSLYPMIPITHQGDLHLITYTITENKGVVACYTSSVICSLALGLSVCFYPTTATIVLLFTFHSWEEPISYMYEFQKVGATRVETWFLSCAERTIHSRKERQNKKVIHKQHI